MPTGPDEGSAVKDEWKTLTLIRETLFRTLKKNTLFLGFKVGIPHSVSSGVAWAGHAISACDICDLLHTDVSSFNVTQAAAT